MTWPTRNPCRSKNAASNWPPGARTSAAPAPAKPRSFPSTANCSRSSSGISLPFEFFDELIKGVEMDLDIKRYADYAELELYCYRVASVVGLVEHRDFRLSESGLPRLRDSPRQGAATDQYFARRAHRRRARPDLSAALRTGTLQGDARGNSAASNIRPRFRDLAGSVARARAAFLPAGPRHAAARRTAAPWSPPN